MPKRSSTYTVQQAHDEYGNLKGWTVWENHPTAAGLLKKWGLAVGRKVAEFSGYKAKYYAKKHAQNLTVEIEFNRMREELKNVKSIEVGAETHTQAAL